MHFKTQKYSGLFSLSETVIKVIDRRDEMFGPTYLCFIMSHIMKVEFYFTGKTKCSPVSGGGQAPFKQYLQKKRLI